jgi:hypothetical protein
LTKAIKEVRERVTEKSVGSSRREDSQCKAWCILKYTRTPLWVERKEWGEGVFPIEMEMEKSLGDGEGRQCRCLGPFCSLKERVLEVLVQESNMICLSF